MRLPRAGVKTLSARNSTRTGMRAKISGSQSGQALIELALIVPLLLAALLGVIEIGRYAYIGILIGNAAHAGAFYGAQGHQKSNDSTGIRNAAQYDFAAGTGSADNGNGQPNSLLSVTSSTSCGCDSGGTITPAASCTTFSGSAPCTGTARWVVFVSVTASGQFNSLFNYPGIPTSITISRTATMTVAPVA
jgi:Flp pilus assembly protein TadG